MTYTDLDGTVWERPEDAADYWAERARHSRAKGFYVVAQHHAEKRDDALAAINREGA